MKRKVILIFACFINGLWAQTYIVFENNKKNKSLFDYDDPYSLVNVLLQNKSFLEKNPEYGVTSDAIHPTEGMMSYYIQGPLWEIQRPNSMDTYILMRNSENESFDDWYLRLTTKGDSSSFDPMDYESLKLLPIEDLKVSYNNSKQYQALKIKPTKYFYDLRDINLIFMDSSTIYFAKKSPYEDKHFITFRISKEHLFNLMTSDFYLSTNDFRFRLLLSGDSKKNLINKLRDFQLTNKELDKLESTHNYNDLWVSEFNSDLFEIDFYNGIGFDQYKYNGNVISKKIPGEYWNIYSQEYGEIISLMRNSNSESFDDWFNRLTTFGDSITLDPLLYADLIFESHDNLKKQYDLCSAYNFLKKPDTESVYWVDYPNPMVYINCKIVKDSLVKKTCFSPYEIVISERIDYKKGPNSKPLILMSFGQEETGLPKEIENLLSNELSHFKKLVNFKWMNILKTEKGRKANSSELKKTIHVMNFDSNGIKY